MDFSKGAQGLTAVSVWCELRLMPLHSILRESRAVLSLSHHPAFSLCHYYFGGCSLTGKARDGKQEMKRKKKKKGIKVVQHRWIFVLCASSTHAPWHPSDTGVLKINKNTLMRSWTYQSSQKLWHSGTDWIAAMELGWIQRAACGEHR